LGRTKIQDIWRPELHRVTATRACMCTLSSLWQAVPSVSSTGETCSLWDKTFVMCLMCWMYQFPPHLTLTVIVRQRTCLLCGAGSQEHPNLLPEAWYIQLRQRRRRDVPSDCPTRIRYETLSCLNMAAETMNWPRRESPT
jgi:hypothetical protein